MGLEIGCSHVEHDSCSNLLQIYKVFCLKNYLGQLTGSLGKII